jgi:hypothetical protein
MTDLFKEKARDWGANHTIKNDRSSSPVFLILASWA